MEQPAPAPALLCRARSAPPDMEGNIKSAGLRGPRFGQHLPKQGGGIVARRAMSSRGLPRPVQSPHGIAVDSRGTSMSGEVSFPIGAAARPAKVEEIRPASRSLRRAGEGELNHNDGLAVLVASFGLGFAKRLGDEIC